MKIKKLMKVSFLGGGGGPMYVPSLKHSSKGPWKRELFEPPVSNVAVSTGWKRAY